MPGRDDERLQIAEAVRRELGFENELTRPQARAYVRCLQTTWQVPAILWSDKDSATQLEDAHRLLHAAHIFRSIEGIQSARATDCFRRTGEILEWLSRADDGTRRIVPIELMAAAAYQLGGLPAMASGLLGLVESDEDGVQLYAAFLQADFDTVIRRASLFWRRNLTLVHRGVDGDRKDGEEEPDIVRDFAVNLVRTIGLVADCLRRGDEVRLEVAMTKFRAMDKLANRMLSADAALVVGLMRQVADGYAAATIYKPLKALATLRPTREARLVRYGRDQFSRGRGILWTSQLHGLDRLIRESSFALCTPTGSGKTLVANLALVKELLLQEHDGPVGPLALYIVPSRALAGEVEAKLTAELRGQVIVTGLYGGADWGITDNWLTSEEPVVLIVTVEKADALLRYLGPLITTRLRLLIIDEAHQVVPEANEATRVSFSDHSNRSIRLESLVSRILAKRPEVVRIALTAVAGGAAGPVARWIEGRPDAEPVGVRYRSTRQVIGVFETTKGRPGQILLDLMNGRPLYLRGEEDPVYIPLHYAPMPQLKSTWQDSLNRFNCLSVLWAALHLTAEEQRILISVAQEPELTMRWYKEALELKPWSDVVAFKAPEGALRARFDEARAACIDYCGPDSYELFLLDRGIATSHGQMPQRLRRLMVEMIDSKICPITVATATLTEGVNLPFDIIFLTSLLRRSWDAVKGEQVVVPFTTSEFRNLAGRAGRPGAARGIEGMTLIALPTAISTTAPTKVKTQQKQKREREDDYNRLRQSLVLEEGDADATASPLDLLLKRIWDRARSLLGVSGEDFMDWLEETAPAAVSDDAGTGATDGKARLADAMDELDGVLLAAIEEMDRLETTALSPARLEEALRNLWGRTFTAAAAEREAWLTDAFISRGQGLVEKIYPDAAERGRLYQYGFTPLIGQRFEAVAGDILAVIQRAESYGDLDAKGRLAFFEEIGDLLKDDRGFGFRVRDTQQDQGLLRTWTKVLAWWMNLPGTGHPNPGDLRAWQRFVADNIEFRLGGAVGAVVTQAWSAGAGDPLAVPSLAAWKETTGLPWFGFWARELLRWGTHDPFVAFCLSQGLANTREEAAGRRAEFEAWLKSEMEHPDAEARIDPQRFTSWQGSLATEERPAAPHTEYGAQLTGTTGVHGRYSVVPIVIDEQTRWLDPAGYELAVTPGDPLPRHRRMRNDYELRVENGRALVARMF